MNPISSLADKMFQVHESTQLIAYTKNLMSYNWSTWMYIMDLVSKT